MFYTLVSGFVLGIAVQTLYELSLWWWVLLGGFVSLAGVVAARALTDWSVWWERIVLVFALAGACSVGAGWVELAENRFRTTVYDHLLGSKITLVGVVSNEPDVRSTQQMLHITTEDTKVLVSTDRQYQVGYGDLVEVTGVIERPRAFTTELGRTFNYVGYLQAKGIAYRISFADVGVIDSGYGNPIVQGLLAGKLTFMQMVATRIPEPAAGLSAGLLLGVKQALGDELEHAFRTTGIIHIVVLSGYNVMLVVAFVTTILGYVLSLRARVVVGVLAIAAFALMVGLSATVLRASVMAGLFLVAQVAGRTYQVIRALFVAGVIMVVINPFIVVYDIGFQLSFMATLGLLLVAPRFEVMLMQVPQWLGVRDFFIATVATQIAVLPILLYHIGEVSLVSVPVNMLVLPMVPVAMLTTFMVGVVGFVSSSAALVLAYPAYVSLQYIIVLAEYFAQVPFAALWVPAFSFWWVLILYGSAGVLYVWWKQSQIVSTTATPTIPLALPKAKREPGRFSKWTITEEGS